MFKRKRAVKRAIHSGAITSAAIIISITLHNATIAATKTPLIIETITENTEIVTENAENVHISEENEQKTQVFVILDIPLNEELQKYTFECCNNPEIVGNNPISYTLILAIMDKETGGSFKFDLRSPTNDTGLMQINDCNKESLKTKPE